MKNGAGGETRTPNRPITNRVLYQLSHASVANSLPANADINQVKISRFLCS